MPRAYPEDPDHVADRQARYRARRAKREACLRDTQEKAREAFSDVLAALVRATAAYEELTWVRGEPYPEKLRDYQLAINKARKAYNELFKRYEPVDITAG